MVNRTPRILLAEEREMGVPCAHCARELHLGDPTAICRDCGAVHHAACWQSHQSCGSYECAVTATPAASGQSATLSISHADLAAAVPLPPPRSAAGATVGTAPVKRPWNRIAVGAFAMSLLGIPLFGLLPDGTGTVLGCIGLLVGLLAIVVACIGLVAHTRHRRGLGLAVAAMLIGLFDVVGGSWGLVSHFDGASSFVSLERMTIDPSSLAESSELISRSLRANVLIETSAGLGRHGIGSGVILRLLGGSAYIVTNRHVVDHSFADGTASAPDPGSLGRVMVTTIGDPISVPGKVEWIAPHGVDLAIVSAPIISNEVREAHWNIGDTPHIGDDVFAIGNPQGLGWTHTAGDISQVRQRSADGFSYRVLQTTAAINPGNSGGGLYDAQGHLIGINTLTGDKRVAEGLSFSIAFSTLLKLTPDRLGLSEKNLDPAKPDELAKRLDLEMQLDPAKTDAEAPPK